MLALTSGYPLFVRNVARLATQYHNGNVANLLSEFATASHPETTQQEVILQRTVQTLSPNARAYLAVASAATVALTTNELDKVAKESLGLTTPAKARRELSAIAALEQFGADGFAVRDAYRLLGREHLHERTPAEITKIKRTVADVLRRGFATSQQSVSRVRNYLRLLGEIGDIQELVDVATSLPEWWREIGFEDELAVTLARASRDTTFSLDDRFWATDTLAFFALQEDRLDEAETHLASLDDLMGPLINPRKAATIDGKRMLIAGAREQWETAEAIARDAARYIAHDAMAFRILRYNLARIQWQRGRYDLATSLVSEVIGDYFSLLQLDSSKLLARSVAEVLELLPPSWDSDDVKHLADALDLFAHCQRNLGKPVLLAALHASKLYTIAHALGSAVRVGLDAARDFAEGRHSGRPDPIGAVRVLEHVVLPYIAHERLVGHALEARLLYADLLEATGRFDDARAERARLAPYLASPSSSSVPPKLQ